MSYTKIYLYARYARERRENFFNPSSRRSFTSRQPAAKIANTELAPEFENTNFSAIIRGAFSSPEMAGGAFPEVVFADVRRRMADLRPRSDGGAHTGFGFILTRKQAQ
jgi:hypothetical protein